MNMQVQRGYAEIFFNHFAILRKYAEKVFIDGLELEDHENDDRAARMVEFLGVGAECDFTERQLITLLYAEIF